MLDAGRLSLDRPGRRRLQHDRRRGPPRARGIYVSNCPGKNAIAVAELAFGLILALDRRMPDNVAELRAGTLEQEGVLEGARALRDGRWGCSASAASAREVIRRAAGFGMNVVLWSRRFDGQDRPMTEQEARELGVEPALRTIRSTLAPTPADVASRADILSLHLALGPETQRTGGCRAAGATQAGRDRDQHRARRGRGLCGARRRGSRRRASRRARRLRRRAGGGDGGVQRSAGVAARRLRHASHRRIDRPGAGSDCRRNRPHHPQLQGDRPGAERREPGERERPRRTCSSSATATVPACSPTSSTTCAGAI